LRNALDDDATERDRELLTDLLGHPATRGMLRDVLCDAMERQDSCRALVAAQGAKIGRMVDLLRRADLPLDEVVRHERRRNSIGWKRRRYEKQ